MINAIIVDDEIHCTEVLELLVQKHCPQVRILEVCHSVSEAEKALSKHEVQLVFLDIEMPHFSGFDLLERLSSINFELIFTTSYDHYAIKAIRFSALDYLLKPIDREELQAAVTRAEQRIQPTLPKQFEILLQQLRQPAAPIQHIALPTMEGLQMVQVSSIVSCTSRSNYTIIGLKDGQKLVVSRTLKDMEALLSDHQFLRVHHSHLVNLNEVRKYLKGEGGVLVMSDGSSVDVSRSRKESLLRQLQSFR